MTALLIAALVEVPLVAAVSLWLARRMLCTHVEALATVIGRRARNLEEALAAAEGRIRDAARGGVVSRAGPARLRD